MKGLLALVALVAVAHSAAAAGGRAPYSLAQPAGIVVRTDESLLVAERGTADRILRVDPATGAFTVFARGVPDPFAIARARDGSFLVSSDSGLYRVPRSGGRARLALELPTSPIAVAPDGSVYYAHALSVGRIGPRPGKLRLLARDVSFPHGIALDGRGGLVVGDTGNGRIVRIDLRTRRETTLAEGLRDPMGLVLEPGGAAVAIEFGGGNGRLIRVAQGSVSTVARGLREPYALARARDGGFYVVETGDVVRATGRVVRVDPDGTLTRLLLHPA